MILRTILNQQRPQLGADAYVSGMQESLKMAKDALAIDVTDGVSWYVLGNALMGQYFAGDNATAEAKMEYLKQAMKAYNKAVQRDFTKRTLTEQNSFHFLKFYYCLFRPQGLFAYCFR
eukprot:c16450_g1_i3.p2 GENE.c16450_g1_i3~~c16450_g1_i3.p2  ORF type:complete len:118 (+),score=29.81 c16450_g1_i3:525-878(+)